MTLEIAILHQKKYLNPHIIECEIKCRSSVSASPGQYIFIKMGEQWRPFSVAEIRPGNIIVIIVQPVPGTLTATFVDALTAGKRLEIQEPRGHLSLPDRKDVLLVATGTGIVPLFTVADHILKQGYRHQVKIIFAVQTEDKLFYLDKLRQLQMAYSNCRVLVTVSRPRSDWQGARGRAITHILKQPSNYLDHEFILCGRKETVAAQIKQLEQLGVADSAIQFIE